jgi:hypothetical protein
LFEKGNAFLRPLKQKGFKEAKVTTMRLDDLGQSTPLESDKSQCRNKGILPGFQTAGISRSLEVHDPLSHEDFRAAEKCKFLCYEHMFIYQGKLFLPE